MKKLLLSLAMALMCSTGFAKTVNEVMDEFKGKPDVTFVDMPKSMLQSKINEIDKPELKAIVQKVKALRVLTFNKASAKVNQDFAKAVGKLDLDDYRPIVSIDKDNKGVKVLSHGTDDLIDQLLVLVTSKDNSVMVQLTGAFTQDELGQLTSMMGDME